MKIPFLKSKPALPFTALPQGLTVGKKALVLKTIPNTDHASGAGLVTAHSGFSLHAGVAVGGGERKKLEKLARYIARPPIAQDRLRLSDTGQVIYQLKKPYSDGTSHIVMNITTCVTA